MLWYRTDATITEDWQAESAYSLEAGKRPLFNLGHSNTAIDGVLGLTALQKIVANYQAIVQPLVSIGGHSALWLFALLQTSRTNASQGNTEASSSQPHANQSSAQMPTVLFSGVDPSTQIALLATQQPAEQSKSAVSPKKYRVGLDKSLRHLFAPASEPSAITAVESLPFTTTPIRIQHQNIHTQPKRTHSSQPTTPARASSSATEQTTLHEQTVWMARTMIGFALLLLLAAVIMSVIV